MTKAGTVSYLPPLTNEQVRLHVRAILERGLVPEIEFTTEPGPRQIYWSMWTLPMFDSGSLDEVLQEIEACARANPGAYVRLNGYDFRHQRRVTSLVVRQPGS